MARRLLCRHPVPPREYAEAPRGRVLLVDDDPHVLRAFQRLLEPLGFTIVTANDGRAAATHLDEKAFDAVVSDIAMPQLDGVGLLRLVRERHPDLPVILITGDPSVQSAASAVEHGALHYLPKPVPSDRLRRAVADAVQRHRAIGPAIAPRALDDTADLVARFDRAIDGLWMAYQPIVCWSRQEVFGHEALVRSDEPTLADPAALFAAAERLNAVQRLGRAIRERIAERLDELPAPLLFINLHPADLLDEAMLSPSSPLAPGARRIVFEITEREALHAVSDLPDRLAALRRLGYRLALDDLGAGYASLSSFAALGPDVIKVDMSLTRDVDGSPFKQKLVFALHSLCENLGTSVIVEGVERVEERDALLGLGCDLFQGYLFARPGREFPPVTW